MPLLDRLSIVAPTAIGADDPRVLRTQVALRVVQVFLLLGFVVGLLGILINVVDDRPSLAIAFGLVAVLSVVAAALLVATKNVRVASIIASAAVFGLEAVALALAIPDGEPAYLFWLHVFVPIALVLAGPEIGAALIGLLVAWVIALATWSHLELGRAIGAAYLREAAVSLTVVFLLYFTYESVRRLYEHVLAHLHRRLEELSTTDQLTGAHNRRMIESLLAEALSPARVGVPGFCVVLFDLDRFKAINDTWGHRVGDRVLEDASRIVRGAIRASDRFGRWGGEEFIIVCPDTSLDEARAVAERARAALDRHPFPEVGRVTASFGVAALGPGEQSEDVVRRADRALYRAKEAGRNAVEVEAAGAGG